MKLHRLPASLFLLLTLQLASAQLPSPSPAVTFEDRLDAALAEQKPSRRYRQLSQLLNNLALEDIPRALAAISQLPRDGKDRDLRSLYSLLFSRWATFQDPLSLQAEADKIAEPTLRDAASSALLKSIAKKDPAAAFASILALPPGNRRDTLINSHLARWAQNDPDRALEAVEKADPALIPFTAVNSLLVGLTYRDPVRALDLWLRAQKDRGPRDPDRFQSNLSAIFKRYGQIRPLEAVERAKALERQDWRDLAYAGIAEGWSDNDPQAAFTWLQENKLFTPQIGQALFIAWTKRDPRSALTGLAALGDSDRIAMSLVVAQYWAQSDPAAALAWAGTLPESTARLTLLRNIISDHARSQPATAAAETRLLPPGPQRIELVGYVTGEWARIDPPAARSWSETLADPSEKIAALESLAHIWPTVDLPAALAWAGALPAGPDRTATLQTVLLATPGRHLIETAQWLQTLPPADSLALANNFAQFLTRQNSAEAEKWVTALPLGALRDEAIVGFFLADPKGEPADHIALASSIQDREKQAMALSAIATAWLKTDLTAATTWITTSDALSDTDKRRILATANNR